jgi:hypothetical protein
MLEMTNYKLFQSKYIIDNRQEFIDQCLEVKKLFSGQDTTKLYYQYNIFSLTAGSIHFYNLFQELRNIIRAEVPQERLWMQAWVNLHTVDNVLDWHDHQWNYHGYISIDPKHTVTEFHNYSINNTTGQIYFGPGNRPHRVKVVAPYSGERITIGYDVTSEPIMHTGCVGLFPLI